MGETKQLLSFGRSTILEQVIDNVLGSKINKIIVVLGHDFEKIVFLIGNRPVNVVINPNYREGMSSSIKCGLSCLERSPGAVLIALGDQPFITSDTINRLIEKYHKDRRGIIVPVHKGLRGHPVIFDMRYREELMGLTGDTGGKKIVEAHPEDVAELETDSESVIKDIDNKKEYERRLKEL